MAAVEARERETAMIYARGGKGVSWSEGEARERES